MSTYNKSHLTFEQQLELLKSRGLGVTNDIKAIEHLRRIGYYRLSAYWHPLRKLTRTTDSICKQEDEFVTHAIFQHAVELYIFPTFLHPRVYFFELIHT
jgi:abortive infection bacteriophage resistance protein